MWIVVSADRNANERLDTTYLRRTSLFVLYIYLYHVHSAHYPKKDRKSDVRKTDAATQQDIGHSSASTHVYMLPSTCTPHAYNELAYPARFDRTIRCVVARDDRMPGLN